jgi:hypothetical protein
MLALKSHWNALSPRCQASVVLLVLAAAALATVRTPPFFTLCYALSGSCLGAAGLLLWHSPSRSVAAVSTETPQDRQAWFLGGLLVVCGVLGMLENIPLYFVADDNHRQYLPVLVNAMRGFFATGILPTWDAYSGLGMVLINGGYPLTYPPLYASYLLAVLLGNDLLMFECFAFMHFIAAYAVMWLALRRFGASALLAACASASYVLAGYHLTQGRSWVNVVGVPLYMAAFLYLLSHLIRGERLTPRWAVLAALAVGLFYHLGHPQFWIYGMTGVSVAALWALTARGAWRELPMLAAGLMGGLALAAPLLYVQWLEQGYVAPVHERDLGVTWYLEYLALPWNPLLHRGSHGVNATWPFAGGVYTFALLGLLAWCVAAIIREPRRWPAAGGLVAAAALTMMLAMGDGAPLWPLLNRMPVFEKFRYNDKWQPMMIAFFVAGGTYAMAAWGAYSPRRRRIVHACALIGVCASVYNASHCTKTVSQMGDTPYPPLPSRLEEFRSAQEKGTRPYRLLSVGPANSSRADFVQRLNNNYASHYGIFVANRYNQRITTSPPLQRALGRSSMVPDQFLRHYAVGWFLRGDWKKYDSGYQPDYNMERLVKFAEEKGQIAERIPVSPGLELLDIRTPGTDPLVGFYPLKNPAMARPRALSFTTLPDGLLIDLRPAAFTPTLRYAVIAAFLSHEWFHAYAEPGHRELAFFQDPFDRLWVNLDAPAEYVRIRLEPPWLTGLALGAGLLLAAMGCGLAATRWPRRDKSPARADGATHGARISID